MISRKKIHGALFEALKKIDANISIYNYSSFPAACSVNHVYPAVINGTGPVNTGNAWIQGFYTGMLWLSYEATDLDKFKKAAHSHYFSFNDRLNANDGLNHHDMGFLFSLSTAAQYELTGYDGAKKATLRAANILMNRFQEKGQFIQAWGEMGASDNYRLIIDCNMNVPLLMWASENCEDASLAEQYKRIGLAHWQTAKNVLIRDDGSTHHTYFFDSGNGEPLYGRTAQGYSDNSAWARGQAWGIYGFALAYRYTHDSSYLNLADTLIEYYIAHLPQDYIPYWDLVFTEEDGEEKDSSAAAIVVCGLQEFIKHIPNHTAKYHRYQDILDKTLNSLILNYTTADMSTSTGLLTQAVYAKNPSGKGVNECCIWGDYFYMEALINCLIPQRKSYW